MCHLTGYESYVQEIGRAGRDGLPAECHVFLEPQVFQPLTLYHACHEGWGSMSNASTSTLYLPLGLHYMFACRPIQYKHFYQQSDIDEDLHGDMLLCFQTADLSELEKHTYANCVDVSSIRRLLSFIYKPCSCERLASLSQETNEQEGNSKKVCPGHERAIPLDETIEKLNITEQGDFFPQ